MLTVSVEIFHVSQSSFGFLCLGLKSIFMQPSRTDDTPISRGLIYIYEQH